VTWICSQCGEKSTRYRQRCARDGHRIVEDLAGQVIGGRYRLRELIGVGGMDSAVWKAWQMGAERLVAVKILPPADDAAVKRFSRGARIAANLNHPNCLVIHDYGTAEDGKLYLVMELLNGQVLNDALTAEGMAVEDTIHIADQVLQALEQAHNERAVHRDLKPDNLFLCKKNDDPYHVKILDFGIAKYIEEDYDEVGGTDGKASEGFEDLVTEQRQVCGTPQYMAPEQVVGARVDGRADLYALGCVLYRMLTGRLPFDGKTRYELYQKHLQEAPRPFIEVRPDLQFPERLELIVMKALAKRPQHRFQSAAEMREALASVPIERSRAKRGQKPRVALKDTSPQNATQPTVTGPGLGDQAFEAALAQAPLKPSFVAARPTQPEPVDQPTVVRGIPAMGDWEPDEPAAAAQATDPDVLQPANPTMLPHGVWTLSRPSPHAPQNVAPQPVAPAGDRPPTASIKRPTTAGMPAHARVPTHGQPRVPTPQSQQAAPTHPDGSQRSLSQTPPGSRPVSSLATPAMQAVPGGWPQPTGMQSMARQAPDYMGDAVLRHPASRSMLSTGSAVVPRSSETEPSSVSRMQDRERPRWFVPVMLGGAFLLGVGGVSLGMSLFGDASTPEVAEAADSPEPIAPAKEGTAQANGQALPAAVGAVAGQKADEGQPGAVAAPSEPVAAPLLAEVLIESEPAGAEVLRGDEVLGRTPHRIHLEAGQHAFTLRLAGHMNEPLVVDAVPVEGAGALVKRVTLQADALPAPVAPAAPASDTKPPGPQRAPTPTPRVETPRTPAPAAVEPKPAVVTPPVETKPAEPKPVEPKPPEPEKKPREVRLLEELDGPAAPQPKPKPKVNLLDEDDAAPKPKPKPQIKTLDEL
jgi:serine/threonine protein kinase